MLNDLEICDIGARGRTDLVATRARQVLSLDAIIDIAMYGTKNARALMKSMEQQHESCKSIIMRIINLRQPVIAASRLVLSFISHLPRSKPQHV